MVRLISILILFVLGVNANGQLITVKSGFDRDSLMIGKHAVFHISVEAAPGVKVNLPIYSDTITKDIEIISETGIDTLESDQGFKLSASYTVTSFTPGWNTVPPQAISFQKDGLVDTAYSPVALLTVLAPAVDTTQAIKPIKPPINTPLSFQEVLPYASGGIAGLAILAGLALLLIRLLRKKDEDQDHKPEPADPAHVVAFRELDSLEEAKLPHKGMVKEYYSKLTEIIRVYITRQFSIHAMESTTMEILQAFDNYARKEKELSVTLEELLMLADLVKFAKEDPLMEENERNLAVARSFVENTYRMFETEDSEEENNGKEAENE